MKLVFTMTAGRTGTAYLAELFRRNDPDALVAHEFLDWRAFGTRTPEVSHLTRFNNVGFDDYVQAFWATKLGEILETGADCYVETSHVLMKAGLVEALTRLEGDHEIHLIAQQRDRVATMLSYRQRNDFMNIGNRYLWYLDPKYALNLVQHRPFLEAGPPGIRLWYLLEIEARTAFYTGRLAGDSRFTVHATQLEEVTTEAGAASLLGRVMGHEGPIDLPPKVNAGGSDHDPEARLQVAELANRVSTFDAAALVGPLVQIGRDPFAPPTPPPHQVHAPGVPDPA